MKDKIKLVSLISIAVIAVCFGLLALPNQFFDLWPKDASPVGQVHTLNGYQFIFNAGIPESMAGFRTVDKVCGIGLAAMIIAALAAICFALYKFSSALPLFGGILSFVAGLFFLLMKPWGADKVYKPYYESSRILWTSYVIGSFLVLIAIAVIYFSVKLLQEEKAHPKETVGYSYLKK